MRVVHAGNFKAESANGVDRTIHGLAVYTARRGVDVEVWHLTDRVSDVQSRVESGVRVYDLPRSRRPGRFLTRLDPVTESFVEERRTDVDLLHLHSVFVPDNIVLARHGMPYLVTPNGGYETVGRRRAWRKALWLSLFERRYLNSAVAVHTVFQAEANGLTRIGCRVRTVVIPNAIHDELLTRDVAPASAGRSILFLGRLAVEHKGLDLLIQAYAHAAGRADLPELVLAGPDFRGGRDYLIRECRRLGISDRVRFIGPVSGEEKLKVIESARLFALTSRWEGLPFALLEALALARPVMITPGTNASEHVAAAGAGWISEPDPMAIAESLLDFAGGNDALEAKAAAARRLARTRFAWSTAAKRMLEVYEHAVDAGRGRSVA